MGQQQLLLLVLGIVIVGLAVVAGINAFSENQKKANVDAMTNDGVRIASDIQAWVLKPKAFGGLGDEKGDYTDVDFNDIGYTASSSVYSNVNGSYKVGSDCDQATNISSSDVSIEESGDAGTAVYISGKNADTGNEICVKVDGTKPANVGTETYIGDGSSS